MSLPMLVILDIDHTLLHTWTGFSDDQAAVDTTAFRALLLDSYPGSFSWEGHPVCPRPHLERFSRFLLSTNLAWGFYSTGETGYVETVLHTLVPELIAKAEFVWGRDHCIPRMQTLAKDLEVVSETFGYRLDEIVMIDDLPVVEPDHRRLPINSFRISTDIATASNDIELLRMILALQHWQANPDIAPDDLFVPHDRATVLAQLETL